MAVKVVAEAKWSKIRGDGKSAKPDDFPNGCLPLFSSGILCSDCHSFVVKRGKEEESQINFMAHKSVTTLVFSVPIVNARLLSTPGK